jgi:nucleotide-binding universal stress UspA family protein
MFQRLLICTDFADANHRLIHFVPNLIAAGVKQVTFLHVVALEQAAIPVPNEKKIKEAQEQLQPALDHESEHMHVEVRVESGDKPSDVIAHIVHEENFDLVVLGTPTRSLLTQKLFGSTAMNVFQKVSTPIMILRPQLIATYSSEELALRCQHLFRCFLIPYDHSETAQLLVERIKNLVTRDGHSPLKRLHLCWVVDTTRGLPVEFRVQEAHRILEQVRQDLSPLDLMVDPAEVRQGDPITEILNAAQMADVSAIVTSSGELTKKISLLGSSFAAELLRRSWHPLILFPAR